MIQPLYIKHRKSFNNCIQVHSLKYNMCRCIFVDDVYYICIDASKSSAGLFFNKTSLPIQVPDFRKDAELWRLRGGINPGGKIC